MTRFLLAIFLILGFLLAGCGSKVSLNSDEDKTFYAVGTMFGSRLVNLNLSDKELNALGQGLKDAAQGKKPVVDVTKYQQKIQKLFKSRMGKNTGKVKKEGDAYMAKFLKEEGAKKTKSGLAYKVLKEGKGKMPKSTDVVEVHYHGTLIDGTVFDSSVKRNKKVSFPLNRVIKGWTEGLQLVKEGGKIRLVIPAKIGYGDHGAPPKIPGGATLVFDVELFKIKKAVAPKKRSKRKGKRKSKKKKK